MGELIPAELQPLLSEYRAHLERDTFDLVAACYLHGSIALGAFDPARSDVDVIAILRRPISPDDLRALGALHRNLSRRFPRREMETYYVLPEGLKEYAASMEQAPTFYKGLFHVQAAHDVNPVTWWILAHHGITLFGAPPDTLNIPIAWETVRAYTRENLNSYWRGWTRNPRRVAALLTDWGIEWTVTGILRLYYLLRENQMTSKVGAGEYGLRVLPARWHSLIHEALRIRRGGPGARYCSRIARAVEAWRFLRAILREANATPELVVE